jgi:hypothetical protein
MEKHGAKWSFPLLFIISYLYFFNYFIPEMLQWMALANTEMNVWAQKYNKEFCRIYTTDGLLRGDQFPAISY